MTRASASGVRLTSEDAAIVKGMLARGDRQHDIASWFGVNGGRVAEIATGVRFRFVDAAHDGLPPPGPYLSGRDAEVLKGALQQAREALAQAEAHLSRRD